MQEFGKAEAAKYQKYLEDDLRLGVLPEIILGIDPDPQKFVAIQPTWAMPRLFHNQKAKLDGRNTVVENCVIENKEFYQLMMGFGVGVLDSKLVELYTLEE